jgi:hypothetical protein
MSRDPLRIPISLYLGRGGLTMAYDHPRIKVTATTGLKAQLELGRRESVIFEAADFVANGTTYRVKATAMTTLAGIEWPRLVSGCHSPVIDDPIEFTLTLTAEPASTSAASTSTTSTTIINRKGKPEELEP